MGRASAGWGRIRGAYVRTLADPIAVIAARRPSRRSKGRGLTRARMGSNHIASFVRFKVAGMILQTSNIPKP
jgi:hypothetical protein